MATTSQQPQHQQGTSAPLKSVWKKFNESTSNTTAPPAPAQSQPQPQVNGTATTADDAHERDSVSSKDIAHGEGSSQGHSTPASSLTDEAQLGSPTPSTPTPVPVYRPAPLPPVNPWKMRQEEMERKRWKESQETPPVPLPQERVVPRAPTTSAPRTANNKPNGVVKNDGIALLFCHADGFVARAPARRQTRNNVPVPPALGDSEAWPSPDVAATVEKEERSRSTTATSTKEVAIAKDTIAKEVDSREPKEPRDAKKKKWEKLEVNITYDPPTSRRPRGGKFGRNARGGARDSGARGKDGQVDKSDRTGAPRSDGEEQPREARPLDRRAQSLSIEPGHRQHDMPPPEWTRGPVSHEPSPVTADTARRGPSPSQTDNRPRQNHVQRDVSAHSPRSPGSVTDKIVSPPNGVQGTQESINSAPGSPNAQNNVSDMSGQWEDNDASNIQNQPPFNQQSNSNRGRGTGRNFRGKGSYGPNTYPQGQFMPPQQQVPYPPFYPVYPPMQTGFAAPNGRAHSVPYYQSNSPSRYPQPGFQPQWVPNPDFSRLGVQAVPVLDEEIKLRIVRQVYDFQFNSFANDLREYYFSNDNLVKDAFLRKKMDSQGFVPLQVLVTFNRLSSIAHDVPTLLNSLLASSELEVLYTSERGPLVRARHQPTKWVYPMDERDEIARHPGPSSFYFQAHQDTMRQLQEYSQYPYPQPFYFDSQYGFPPVPFRPMDQDPTSPHLDNDGHSAHSPVSPHFDPQNRKLSGEASIFIPNGVPYPPMMNGDHGAFDMHQMRNAIPTVTEEPDEHVDLFDEDNLANVIVIVDEPKEKPIVPALPVNGVNHHKETSEQDSLRSTPVSWRFSDATAATQASTSLSVNSGLSSLTAHEDNTPRDRSGESALTEKNLRKQLIQSGHTESSYPEFHSKAIQSRQSSLKTKKESTQMIHLFQFWADFLRDYWVPSMYTEFIQVAVDDANLSRRTGLRSLFALYEQVLDVKFRTPLWNDFVRLAGEDYRNGHLGGIESVWRIRANLANKGRLVRIQDGDVSRLVEMEIQQPADLDRLRHEVKPASVVLVPYTTVRTQSRMAANKKGQSA
jgi:la-related protein 1